MDAPLAVSITALMAFAGGLALWSDGAAPSAAGAARVTAAVDAFTQSLAGEPRAAAGEEPEIAALAPPASRAADAVLAAFLGEAGRARFEAAAGCRLGDCRLTAEAAAPGRAAHFTLRAPSGRTVLDGAAGVSRQAGGFAFRFRATGPEAICALADEVTLARALLLLLGDDRSEEARQAPRAPAAVALGPDRGLESLGGRSGLSWQALTAAERGVLWRLLERVTGSWHDDLAAAELRRLRAGELEDARVCWAGSRARGASLYLRVQGASFGCELLASPEGGGKAQASWVRVGR